MQKYIFYRSGRTGFSRIPQVSYNLSCSQVQNYLSSLVCLGLLNTPAPEMLEALSDVHKELTAFPWGILQIHKPPARWEGSRVGVWNCSYSLKKPSKTEKSEPALWSSLCASHDIYSVSHFQTLPPQSAIKEEQPSSSGKQQAQRVNAGPPEAWRSPPLLWNKCFTAGPTTSNTQIWKPQGLPPPLQQHIWPSNLDSTVVNTNLKDSNLLGVGCSRHILSSYQSLRSHKPPQTVNTELLHKHGIFMYSLMDMVTETAPRYLKQSGLHEFALTVPSLSWFWKAFKSRILFSTCKRYVDTPANPSLCSEVLPTPIPFLHWRYSTWSQWDLISAECSHYILCSITWINPWISKCDRSTTYHLVVLE